MKRRRRKAVKIVNIRILKEVVARVLSENSILRMLIEAERDYITADEFSKKVSVWMKIMNRLN